MHKVIATVFNYSLDGFLAGEGTDFWKFCFDLLDLPRNPTDVEHDEQRLEFFRSAYAHILGRASYEAMARESVARSNHPVLDTLTAGRKVVFSRTLKSAEWANTTIAAGDTTEEIDQLRRGGDGHIVVWGGVGLWRSLMRLDLIDEVHVDLYPYFAGEGTRLFDDVPRSYAFVLLSTSAYSNGMLQLRYRRRR